MYFFVCLFYFLCDVIVVMMDDISKRCLNNVVFFVGVFNMVVMFLLFEFFGIDGKLFIF